VADDTYETWQPGDVPGWLAGPRGRAWFAVHGRAKDHMVRAARVAVKAAFVADCPLDALAYHVRARLLPRYPGDTDATYRARLDQAWSLWALAGTRAGLLALLAALGFPHAAIYDARDPTPPGEVSWPPDGNPGNWSRFWVFLDTSLDNPFGWTLQTWGGGWHWGDGSTWGSTATPGQVAMIRGALRLFKPAHVIVGGIFVDVGGTRLRWPGM
jgi:hypothetical protein